MTKQRLILEPDGMNVEIATRLLYINRESLSDYTYKNEQKQSVSKRSRTSHDVEDVRCLHQLQETNDLVVI